MQCAQRVVPAQRWVPSAQSRVITGPQEPARKKSGWLGRPGRPRRATGLLHFARVIRRFPFGFSLQSSPFRFHRSLFLAVKLKRALSPVVYPSDRPVPALEMLPGPDIEQILETLPLFGDRPKNNGGQRGGWSPATQTRRPKGRLGESTNQR